MSIPARMTVYGTIAAKGSRTVGVRRDGRAYTRPASSKEIPWTDAVAKQAMWLRGQVEAPAPPYAVELAFYFPRPGRAAHTWPSRLDVDKAARAVLDGLVRGGLLADDRHVTELRASKRWAATAGGECVQVLVEHAEATAA